MLQENDANRRGETTNCSTFLLLPMGAKHHGMDHRTLEGDVHTDKRAQHASLGSQIQEIRILVRIDREDRQLGTCSVDFLYRHMHKQTRSGESQRD